jgi:ribonuclease E
MSNNKMLIDATHPEETRVVVLRGGRVEEFDFESAARKLLRGNIYLAKVTRVEPSLQAAFIEYGGNRHGFLAFNEIHPDYYQIPMADRQALIEEEAAAEAAEEAAVDAHAEALARRQKRKPRRGGKKDEGGEASAGPESDDPESDDDYNADDEDTDNGEDTDENGGEDNPGHRTLAASTGAEDERLVEAVDEAAQDDGVAANENTAADEGSSADSENGEAHTETQASEGTDGEDAGGHGADANGTTTEAEPVEQVSTAEDALEELPSRPRRRPRSYKIQEVIKRRQVILVQVVKEERGNKGAALTTYLSLAGRYTVLMPNTARGGGISRKITQPQDRKRLKAIAADLEVPEGMGLIIRTAGAARTKQEIKRDFEYLLRLWESVRDLTLESQAPSLVYEEGNLIKRSIRDLYNKDVDEVVVAGGEAHREAKDFMRMLMPSHAKNVSLYQEPEPLFTRHKIESQLNAMFSPYVTLRSGGYLVINQTEALVAVDVNSGKSTREFSIEETALNTNLEASDEIARQLKLRDLAGLVVVDFIDMEEKRNNRAVERRLKEALRFDRARIQVGRISHFGLMEMSRQRLRTGVLEGSTSQCPHCQGTGIIRSTESVALAVLRGLEDTIMAGARTPLIAMTTPTVALYILNNKRPFIIDMESRHGMPITVLGSDKLAGANFTIEKGAAPSQPLRRAERSVVNMDWGFEGEPDGETEGQPAAPARNAAPGGGPEQQDDEEKTGRRRRRRRRGGRRGDRAETQGGNGDQAMEPVSFDNAEPGGEFGDESSESYEASEPAREQPGDGEGRPRRRRGRRGGRRGRERQARTADEAGAPQGLGEQPDVEASEQGAKGDAEANTEAGANHNAPPAAEPVAAAPASRPEPEEAPTAEPADVQPPPAVVAEPTPDVAQPEAAAAPPDAEAEPVAEAAKEPTPKAETPPKRSRSRTTPSEPKLERIVVGKEEAAAPEPEEDTSAPARRGWWQRRLGG